MKKTILLLTILCFAFHSFSANWGMWDAYRSYIIFTVKTETGFTKSLWNNGAGEFQNFDFGTFTSSETFQITGYDVKTWKSSGGDVTGCEYFYVIYPTGQRPSSPTFSSLGGKWLENLGDGNQKWGNDGLSVDLLSGLQSGGTYTIEVYGQVSGTGDPNGFQYDNNGGANFTATFTFRKNIVSSGNGNWGTSTIWNNSAVPNSYDNVTIDHNISIDQPSQCNNLTINTSKVLTINTGKSLTVSGTLDNQASSTGLVIKSDASGTGALLHNSNSVAGTVERYFTGSSYSWHLISSPVASQEISGDFTPSGSGYDFYCWYEPSGLWVNKKNTTVSPTWNEANGGTTFITGKGYMVAYEATNPTKSFASASLHNGTVNIPMTISGTGAYARYNLAGNPYPSPIDWKAESGWTRTNLVDNNSGYDFSIFSQTANNYGVYNSTASGNNGTNGVTRYIPVGQGFMVKAGSAGNLTMTNAVRVAQNPAFLKSAGEVQNILSLKAISALQGWSDEIIVEFGHTGDLGGAAKMFSFDADAPSLYTVKDNSKYSIDFRGEAGPVSIPLYFTPGLDGDFTLEAARLESFTPGSQIMLEDLKENNTVDLTANQDYSFYSSKSDPAARFVLHFGGTFSIGSNSAPSAISIFTDGRTIFITTPDRTETTGKIHVFNMIGRQVATGNLRGTTSITLESGLPTGYYLVRVTTETASRTQKVWIR